MCAINRRKWHVHDMNHVMSGVQNSEIPPELLRHLRDEFGSHGERAVEFLMTASKLLSLAEQLQSGGAARIGGAIAYCLREGMTAILASHQSSDPSWGKVSREVVDAKRRYEAVRNYPGADEKHALTDLLRRLDGMERFHQQKRVHERRLLAVMLDRTGSRPLSDDLAGKYQELVSDLSKGVHSAHSVEQAREIWSDCVDLLKRVFLPPEVRLRKLQILAEKKQPSEADVSNVGTLIVTPAHLSHFLAKIEDTVWLQKLTRTGLLDPPDDGGPWPVFGAVSRLTSRDPDAVVDWLTAIYVRSAQSPRCAWPVGCAALDVGEAALPLVVRILREHSKQDMIDIARRAAAIGDASAAVFESIAEFLFEQEPNYANRGLREVAKRLVNGVQSENARRRIELLCRRISLTPQDDTPVWLHESWRYGSIAERLDGSAGEGLAILLRALVDIAREAQQRRWLTTEALCTLTAGIPGTVGLRMRLWLLNNGPT